MPTPKVTPVPTPTPSPTPSPTVSPTPVPIIHPAPYTIAIEAGHGGPYYWGGSTRDSDGNQWIEKDVALEIALRLSERLDADERYVPILIRAGDYTLTDFEAGNYRSSLIAEAQARVDVANAVNADAYLSIHLNGWLDVSQAGTETYYNPDRSFGYQNYGLAFCVQDSLVRYMRNSGYDVHDRGLKNDGEVNGDPSNAHSFVLGTNANFNPSLMPGVISEALFLSSPADLEFLRKPDAFDILADAYKAALDTYFGWLVPPS